MSKKQVRQMIEELTLKLCAREFPGSVKPQQGERSDADEQGILGRAVWPHFSY